MYMYVVSVLRVLCCAVLCLYSSCYFIGAHPSRLCRRILFATCNTLALASWARTHSTVYLRHNTFWLLVRSECESLYITFTSIQFWMYWVLWLCALCNNRRNRSMGGWVDYARVLVWITTHRHTHTERHSHIAHIRARTTRSQSNIQSMYTT